MKKGGNKEDIARMAADLGTIKALLMKVEGNHLVEPWAFYVWGTAFMAGGLLHHLIGKTAGYSTEKLLLAVWLPLLGLASFLEVVSWTRKMKKESVPLYSGPLVKFWTSIAGITAACAAIVYRTIAVHDWAGLAGTMVVLFSVYYYLYALLSTGRLYCCAFGMTAVGAVLLYLDMPEPLRYTAGGLICGLLFFAGGIITGRTESGKHRTVEA